MKRILVTGAGGFIGYHLVKYLRRQGYWVRGADIKLPEFAETDVNEFYQVDLRFFENCVRVAKDVEEIYHLAADMGGIGYITSNHANLTRNNTLIDLHMAEAARVMGVKRLLYTSSACVYPSFLQSKPDISGLKEEEAIPADPEKGYGWEKLFAEQVFTYYHEEYGLDIRLVRFHNIYGPYGTYDGGKEKAPAAIMRKVAMAEDGGEIEVWGDGNQTRSFCYIDDCVEGLVRLMESGWTKPINLGTEEMVTVNELVDIVCRVAGKRLRKKHDLSKPQGVRGRNSDNSLLRKVLGWEPKISLEEGISRTYPWIYGQLKKEGRAKPPEPKLEKMYI